MTTSADLRDQCHALQTRVEAPPVNNQLRSIYMDLAPLIGAIQAAVGQAAREHGNTSNMVWAQQSLEALREAARQVGFDIRLASPAELQTELRSALQHAILTLDALAEAASDSRGSSSPV